MSPSVCAIVRSRVLKGLVFGMAVLLLAACPRKETPPSQSVPELSDAQFKRLFLQPEDLPEGVRMGDIIIPEVKGAQRYGTCDGKWKDGWLGETIIVYSDESTSTSDYQKGESSFSKDSVSKKVQSLGGDSESVWVLDMQSTVIHVRIGRVNMHLQLGKDDCGAVELSEWTDLAKKAVARIRQGLKESTPASTDTPKGTVGSSEEKKQGEGKKEKADSRAGAKSPPRGEPAGGDDEARRELEALRRELDEGPGEGRTVQPLGPIGHVKVPSGELRNPRSTPRRGGFDFPVGTEWEYVVHVPGKEEERMTLRAVKKEASLLLLVGAKRNFILGQEGDSFLWGCFEDRPRVLKLDSAAGEEWEGGNSEKVTYRGKYLGTETISVLGAREEVIHTSVTFVAANGQQVTEEYFIKEGIGVVRVDVDGDTGMDLTGFRIPDANAPGESQKGTGKAQPQPQPQPQPEPEPEPQAAPLPENPPADYQPKGERRNPKAGPGGYQLNGHPHKGADCWDKCNHHFYMYAWYLSDHTHSVARCGRENLSRFVDRETGKETYAWGNHENPGSEK